MNKISDFTNYLTTELSNTLECMKCAGDFVSTNPTFSEIIDNFVNTAKTDSFNLGRIFLGGIAFTNALTNIKRGELKNATANSFMALTFAMTTPVTNCEQLAARATVFATAAILTSLYNCVSSVSSSNPATTTITKEKDQNESKNPLLSELEAEIAKRQAQKK